MDLTTGENPSASGSNLNTPDSNMKRIILTIVSGTVCAILLTGCVSYGRMSGQTGTAVSLSGKNYKMIKAGAMGKSSGFKLLGLIPISSPSYASAKASLYKSVGEPLPGRAVALANQTEDRSSLYLILFSIPRITVTADVVEFVDVPAGGNAALGTTSTTSTTINAGPK
jgi:hypothetical protein